MSSNAQVSLAAAVAALPLLYVLATEVAEWLRQTRQLSELRAILPNTTWASLHSTAGARRTGLCLYDASGQATFLLVRNPALFEAALREAGIPIKPVG